MRVLHVFKTYYPDTHGGTEQFIHQLAHQTQGMGVDNTVFTLSTDPQNIQPISVKGIRVVQAQQTGHHFSMPWSISGMLMFRRLVRDCDVIHFHHPWPYADLLYLWFGRKKPAILTYHLDLVRSPWVVAVYRPLMHYFFRRLKALVCTSEAYVKSSQPLQTYLDKTTAIPIGVDESSYPSISEDLKNRWHNQLGQGFALFMGAFRYYKGLPDLMHACTNSAVRLVVLGSGPLEKSIHQLAKDLGLGDRVQFVGAVSDEDKVAILSLARVVVLPSVSRAEAFGIALLEGMMASKPLISTELQTGTSWVNQDHVTGRVVPAGNSDALREALEYFDQHPQEAEKMGESARKRFDQYFTAERMARAYVQLYQRVLQS